MQSADQHLKLSLRAERSNLAFRPHRDNAAKKAHHLQRQHSYFVYMLTGASRRALYTGVTNNLSKRLAEHRSGEGSSFTSKYKLDRLVYYEIHKYVANAINREKQIKAGSRAKKDALIRSINPGWRDLSLEWEKPVILPWKPPQE